MVNNLGALFITLLGIYCIDEILKGYQTDKNLLDTIIFTLAFLFPLSLGGIALGYEICKLIFILIIPLIILTLILSSLFTKPEFYCFKQKKGDLK